MIGISIVLLVTFLCLALPGLLFYPTKVRSQGVKTLTLTLTRRWHLRWKDIIKTLTRLLHRPEHRPLPALRVHLEADYVGLPRLAHPPSSVDHDYDHVQVVLVVITTMILQPILILTSDKELKLKSKQFVMAESWLRHFFIYIYIIILFISLYINIYYYHCC